VARPGGKKKVFTKKMARLCGIHGTTTYREEEHKFKASEEENSTKTLQNGNRERGQEYPELKKRL